MAPPDARVPERLAAVDREREEEPDLARLPELAFEREAEALEPELFLAALEAPVDLRDEALVPLDFFRAEPLDAEAEPPLLPVLALLERAELERPRDADEPEADDPEADAPLPEPDDVRFLAVPRPLEPLSFSTAMSSSHRDRRSGSARLPAIDSRAGKACYRATPPLPGLHENTNPVVDEVRSADVAAGRVDPG
ncbi:MAG TPA: hypothetical protein VGG87_03105 [Solirubrobacteraceae bacterium]